MTMKKIKTTTMMTMMMKLHPFLRSAIRLLLGKKEKSVLQLRGNPSFYFLPRSWSRRITHPHRLINNNNKGRTNSHGTHSAERVNLCLLWTYNLVLQTPRIRRGAAPPSFKSCIHGDKTPSNRYPIQEIVLTATIFLASMSLTTHFSPTNLINQIKVPKTTNQVPVIVPSPFVMRKASMVVKSHHALPMRLQQLLNCATKTLPAGRNASSPCNNLRSLYPLNNL